jgi:hypothetical protein
METKEQMCKQILVSDEGAPSPPYYFHLIDIDSLAEGVQGATRAFPILQ